MKKRFFVTAALAAGLCFAGSSAALAGHWEEVPNEFNDPFGWPPMPAEPD